MKLLLAGVFAAGAGMSKIDKPTASHRLCVEEFRTRFFKFKRVRIEHRPDTMQTIIRIERTDGQKVELAGNTWEFPSEELLAQLRLLAP